MAHMLHLLPSSREVTNFAHGQHASSPSRDSRGQSSPRRNKALWIWVTQTTIGPNIPYRCRRDDDDDVHDPIRVNVRAPQGEQDLSYESRANGDIQRKFFSHIGVNYTQRKKYTDSSRRQSRNITLGKAALISRGHIKVKKSNRK